MSEILPDNHTPARQPLLVSPRLIELCFQTAGLWELSVHGRFGLPQHVDSVRVSRVSDPGAGGLLAVVVPNADGSFNGEVLDRAGNSYVQVSGYRTVALAMEVAPEPLKALQAVA
jgi:hypothetical protein